MSSSSLVTTIASDLTKQMLTHGTVEVLQGLQHELADRFVYPYDSDMLRQLKPKKQLEEELYRAKEVASTLNACMICAGRNQLLLDAQGLYPGNNTVREVERHGGYDSGAILDGDPKWWHDGAAMKTYICETCEIRSFARGLLPPLVALIDMDGNITDKFRRQRSCSI